MIPADFLKFLQKKPAEKPWPKKTTVVECSRCSQRLTFVGRVVLLDGLEWCSCGGTFSPIYTWNPEEDEGEHGSQNE